MKLVVLALLVGVAAAAWQAQDSGGRPSRNEDRPPPEQQDDSQPLTAEQKAEVKAILSKYNPSSLTARLPTPSTRRSALQDYATGQACRRRFATPALSRSASENSTRRRIGRARNGIQVVAQVAIAAANRVDRPGAAVRAKVVATPSNRPSPTGPNSTRLPSTVWLS